MCKGKKHLTVVKKGDGQNIFEELKGANQKPIIAKLKNIRSNLAETVGPKNPLCLLTSIALETGKSRYLKAAEEAYQNQDYRFRRAVENGWVPLNEPGRCQMLRIQGNEQGDGDVWFAHELTIVDDFDEDGLVLPDVAISISEGAPKDGALEILKRAIDQISQEWEVMVKEKAKST